MRTDNYERHLMVEDNIYRDATVWLTVGNTGVRGEANTRWQDGKHKESEDKQVASLGILVQWKGEPGPQEEGEIALGREHDAHLIQLWGHELSRNMELRSLGEFF